MRIYSTKRFMSGKAVLRALSALLVCLLALSGPVWAEEEETADEIPWSMIVFKEKYPEASDYVDAYPEKHLYLHEVDLEGEVTEGTIPLFIQWDERWGYVEMDNSYIGISGCGPTCLSMVVCGLTGSTDWNPKALAAYTVEHNYYHTGSGTSWDLMTTGAEDLGLAVEEGEITADYINEKLKQGCPIICSVMRGDFTYTGHYIVLRGLTAGGRILVNDPNSRINSSVSWRMDELLPQIKALWSYTVSKSQQPDATETQVSAADEYGEDDASKETNA